MKISMAEKKLEMLQDKKEMVAMKMDMKTVYSRAENRDSQKMHEMIK